MLSLDQLEKISAATFYAYEAGQLPDDVDEFTANYCDGDGGFLNTLAHLKIALTMCERLAASLALAIHDAHPVYSSTAKWRGGIGGQAMTQGCSFIDPPPDDDWTQYDLLSTALREYMLGSPEFDLGAAKKSMKEELLGKLG